MSNNLPKKLRALAQEKGQKLTARDVAVLIRAANAMEELERERSLAFNHYRDNLYEGLDTKARLNGLLEVLEGAILEARE